jgi:hypothetical protein
LYRSVSACLTGKTAQQNAACGMNGMIAKMQDLQAAAAQAKSQPCLPATAITNNRKTIAASRRKFNQYIQMFMIFFSRANAIHLAARVSGMNPLRQSMPEYW